MSVKVVYHGHSTVELHATGHRIQIDPFYNHNPLADVKAEQIKTDYIFLSHAHFDHIDDAAAISKANVAPIVSNFEITSYFAAQKLETRPMNHGGCARFPFGKATYTIAFHTSSFPDGTYGGNPGGWIFELEGKTIFFAGDTALFSDLSLYGKLYNIDLAILPIGDNFTMGPAHAIIAADMLKAKAVIPIHYNTFDAIRQDPKAFAANLKKQTGIEGLPLIPGETFTLI